MKFYSLIFLVASSYAAVSGAATTKTVKNADLCIKAQEESLILIQTKK